MNRRHWNEAELAALERRLQYAFRDRSTLEQALTHRSFAVEYASQYPYYVPPADQQRLEFLGDSFLGYTVARWLFDRLPDAREGELTRLRQRFVESHRLMGIGAELRLGELVRTGRGEAIQSSMNQRLLEDTVEALIGAVLLDGGEEEAGALVARLTESLPLERLSEPDSAAARDPLVEWLEAYQSTFKRPVPRAVVTRVPGTPDHLPEFEASHRLVDGTVVSARGRKAQDARRALARAALEYWKNFGPLAVLESG